MGGGGVHIRLYHAQTRIPVKNQCVEILIFLYIPKCMLGTLETIFFGQKTFRLVGGSLS